MTVKELALKYSFEPLAMPNPDKTVTGGYMGDLLSWVMGSAESNNAWFTIMTNVNIVAVAVLADVACVIVCENAKPDNSVIETAMEKGVNILLSPKTSFLSATEVCKDI